MGAFDADLMLVIGMVLGVLAVPAAFSAMADDRRPWGSAVVVLIAGGMIGAALVGKPGGYRWADLPETIFSVVARVIQ